MNKCLVCGKPVSEALLEEECKKDYEEKMAAWQREEEKAGINPKDLLGAKKVSFTKFPPIAYLLGSRAMMNGAEKYGPYNWRTKKVQASIYVDAAIRHLLSWLSGEEEAPDSKIHHLGHAIATIAVVLDAQMTACLVDDRPKTPEFVELLEELNEGLRGAAPGAFRTVTSDRV